jgi:putative iron-regulated protein
MKKIYFLAFVLGFVTLNACKDDENKILAVDTTLNQQILADFSVGVASSTYTDLAAKADQLKTQFSTLQANKTDINLAIMRQTWRDARTIWEQSEAHLFGPVSTENIDPRIDTWPVNFTDLDAQLASDNAFNESYIDGLDDALKGFHPIEYILFGNNGTKKAADLTDRQMEYLQGLVLNLVKLTAQLEGNWDPSSSSTNYINAVSKAGEGSAEYATQLAAFEELVNAMAGICDEVANGKLAEPYEQKNPALEESPFASNSIIDFTNNIKGVQNVYLGNYKSDGKGLEDLVKLHNLSLDADIKAKLNAAITALGNITDPFGTAITTQPVQIQNAMNAINDLKNVLEVDLADFITKHSN